MMIKNGFIAVSMKDIPYLGNVQQMLLGIGVGKDVADLLIRITIFLIIFIIAFLAHFVVKKLIVGLLYKIIRSSKVKWDDAFIEHGIFLRLSYLVPALVLYSLSPLVFADNEITLTIVQRFLTAYIVLVILFSIDAALNAAETIFRGFEFSRRLPVRAVNQTIKIIIYFLGVILVLSLLIGRSPTFFFGGLGAMAAVLMLVFKDPILGFVAGIQLSANRMLHVGDWIEMPKYGADGSVIDVALTTIKVQNWDKTISTIPSYALISDSFKNWRGMSESGGRRIKRSINIDMNTIGFCNEEMLQRYSKITYIKDYLRTKLEEIGKFNQEKGIELDVLANGRRLTNVGTFRAYIVAYLKDNPNIHPSLTFLVRHLAPTEKGLPIEIYVFSKDQVWANYEAIQADIFDHILAVLPQFDLRVFQLPSGKDISAFAESVSH